MFGVSTEMVVHHQQYLASPYVSLIGGFNLFVGVYFAGEITCHDVGECRQQFRIQSYGPSNVWASTHASLIQSHALSGR